MNFCPHAEEMTGYLLRQLNEEEKRAFEAHLASCPVCQKEMALERVIEDELRLGLDPGCVEHKIIDGYEVYKHRDMRSFWLYAYRTAVLGIAAAVACFVLLPLLLRSSIGSLPILERSIAGMVGGLATIDPVYLFMGFGYFVIAASSIYAYAQLRR